MGKNLVHYHGMLSYRRKSTGAERGREYWSLTRHRDGTRTMRCVAMTEDSQFVRDVTYTLGKDHRPLDVFIRLQVGERFVGSGYFRVEGDQMRVVTDGWDTGHVNQTLCVPECFYIVTHAVMLDGWMFWSYDKAKGGEQCIPIYNTSTQWDGTDGPLGRQETLRVTLVGEEEMEVPAGRFHTTHFRFESDFINVPTSDLWITGEDLVLVKYDWSGLGLEYVLVSLVTEGGESSRNPSGMGEGGKGYDQSD